jgi:predicted HicB family RNase H-like nuclease
VKQLLLAIERLEVDHDSSGKFMVRVPPQVHKKLAIEAAESGVSLNRLASAKLSG